MLWIGQCRNTDQLNRAFLYSTENDVALQRDFFYGHIGHRLEFNTSEFFDATYSYREISRDD